MVPSVLLPPGAVPTCQSTPKVEFCTVAVNCTVPFTAIFAADAETLTLATGAGGGSELPAAAPPPQEACKSENSRAAAQAKPSRKAPAGRRDPAADSNTTLEHMDITFQLHTSGGERVIWALAGVCLFIR